MAYQAGPFSWTAAVSARSDSDMRVSPTRTRAVPPRCWVSRVQRTSRASGLHACPAMNSEPSGRAPPSESHCATCRYSVKFNSFLKNQPFRTAMVVRAGFTAGA